MTAFNIAVEEENIDVIKLLLSCDKIDVNCSYILNIFFVWNDIFKLYFLAYFNGVYKSIF